MFEKVNPSHPDKVADRIAGAIVDLAYKIKDNPKVAVEVLIGHGLATVIVESDTLCDDDIDSIERIVNRISPHMKDINVLLAPQDAHLNDNQLGKVKCGDNGIFKGVPVSYQERSLSRFAKKLYIDYPYDGKYIVNDDKTIVCQSHLSDTEKGKIAYLVKHFMALDNKELIINPLGEWTGGTDVDSGATNRKLGSDMGRGVTGGGLHGKDLSKADVSVNIYAHLRAQQLDKEIELSCAIGDDTIDGLPYSAIVEVARDYIEKLGGFEKFAEWGLV